jgi:importin subunit alpha-1
LLYTAQERNWIPLLLNWLNLHDRPAVQVEALLALTNIAELCAQQSYYQHTQAQSSAVAAAAQAAAAVVKGSTGASGGASPFYPFGGNAAAGTVASNTNNNTAVPNTPVASATYPYPSLVAPAPGSVPFPPLSFSQTLSAEAVAAFDASLTSTIQNSNVVFDNQEQGGKSSFSLPPAPLFPSAAPLPAPFSNSGLTPPTGGINFTSLAPPPGGAHSAVPSNSFLPPPTPVPGSTGGALSSFPQQLSPSSQHLLLRHADAIPTLISLLSSPNREVYEQSMWILGSIAVGDSPGTSSSGGSSSNSTLEGGREKSVSARDVILAAGVMNQLLRCLEAHPENLSLQRIGSWTLSNLVEGIFQQPSHGKNGGTSSNKSSDYSSSDEIEMATLLPVLRRLLRTADSEVLSYTCWTLSHLCDGPSSHIAEVVTTKDPKALKGGLVPRLVDLLLHPSWRVTKPALRTIGNIVCAECSDDNNHGATTDYTEVILECGAVPRLKELVTHGNREIQKEACWTLSNIAAGTVDQIQAVIDSGAIPPLVKLVRDKKTDQEVRSEACWVVLNATSCGSDSQIEVLVDEGCVSVLGVLLSEASMVMMALEGLERVLQVEETREMVRREQIDNGEIEDEDGTRTPTLVSAALIEKARESHNSSAVTKRADRIWKQHFVSCALCKLSFSKHRTADATFCDECKCYVCFKCNCQVYHLSYQEELWAESEEKTEQKKSSKKNKNKKRKEKAKQKKAKQETPPVTFAKGVKEGKSGAQGAATVQSRSTVSSTSDASDKQTKETDEITSKPEDPSKSKSATDEDDDDNDNDDEDDDKQNQQPAIDFVLYLQQTGSIIALAKLMDALEYGEDFDEGLDDSELKLIREQQMLSQSQPTQ